MIKKLPNELSQRIQNDYNNIAGVVVLKDNKIKYEGYFHGYNKNDTIHIASVTKSVMSLLIGILLDKGLIQNVDQNILDFFPDYKIKRGERLIQKVTLKHLLTMTAPYKFKYEPYTKVYTSESWTKAALDLLGGKNFNECFKYTTVGMQILSGIIENTTGDSVCKFALENLFKPLDIKLPENILINNRDEYNFYLKDKYVNGWVVDPNGTNTGGWGLTLTTNDLAKIGLLCMNKGEWNNSQIISEMWIEESTGIHSKWENLLYGYLWWIIGDGSENCFAAIGDGGNIIYIDPKNRCVIAITSKFMPRAKDRIELIRKHILPLL